MSIFKNKRRYFFQAVASAHMASLLPSKVIDDTERTNARNFAFGFMSAAAKKVIPDDSFSRAFHGLSLSDKQSKQNASAAKPIDVASTVLQTKRDIQLLVLIFQSHGEHAAALSVLDDDSRTGLGSAIAAGSWQLMVEKVKLLEACKRWEELWQICHAVLLDAASDQSSDTGNPNYSYGKLGDDYSMWRGLATAAANIGAEEVTRKTLDAFSNLTTLDKRSRFLGQLEFYLHPANVAADKTSLVASLFEYQNVYRVTSSNFRDISYFIDRIDVKEKKKFLLEAATQAREIAHSGNSGSEATTIRWIRAEINSLKIDYNMVVSKRSNLSNKAVLESFAANCLRLYQVSLQVERSLPITERRCGDDAAILAAMACIHLAHRSQGYALLQCIIILETLLNHSRHNSDGIVLLVRVYVCLGAVSKAFEVYERLDIKNIQTQTLSWILLSRISTIHPHTSRKFRCHPGALAEDCLRWASQMSEKSPKLVQKHLDEDDALGLCEAVSVSNMLQSSRSRQVLLSDHARIKRYHGSPVDPELKDVHAFKNLDWSDIRDSAALPSYEHYGQPTIDQYIRAGPVPARAWIILHKCLDIIRWAFQGTKDMTLGGISQRWVGTSVCEDHFTALREVIRSRDPVLTAMEYSMAGLVLALKTATAAMADAYYRSFCSTDDTVQALEQGLVHIAEAEKASMATIDEFDDAFIFEDRCWREIYEQPQRYFQKMGWEFFHEYYIEAEQTYLYSCFVHIVFLFRAEARKYAAKLPPGLEKPQFVDLKGRRATELIELKRDVVCRLQGVYRGNDCVKEMTESMENAAINLYCDLGMINQHCRSLAESFLDALDGILNRPQELHGAI